MRDASRRNEVMEAIVTIVAMTSVTTEVETRAKVRFWRSINGRNCVGRFVPSLHERGPEEAARAESSRDLTRCQEVGEIEVNMQLGTFSLSTSRLEGVDERIAAFPDFKELFGPEGSKAQCAAVQVTKRRVWVRMVGRRHDLHLWKPDDRAQQVPCQRKPTSLLLNVSDTSLIILTALNRCPTSASIPKPSVGMKAG